MEKSKFMETAGIPAEAGDVPLETPPRKGSFTALEFRLDEPLSSQPALTQLWGEA